MNVVRSLLDNATRLRYASYLAITGAFTVLFVYVTVRFAINGGDAVGTAISALITCLLGYQTRRLYRHLAGRVRTTGD